MRTKSESLCRLIEDFVNSYKEEKDTSPTMREIAAAVSVSKSTVSNYLSYMRENGRLDYDGYRNITTHVSRKIKEQSVKVPVLGVVSCGVPKFAEENIEEYVRLPVALFGNGDFFILRASGDSMIEVGIDNGDLVLIRKQNYADDGQIVVALIDDEATLKRYFPEPENHRVRLHPENERLSDIYVDYCIIQGVALKVLKDLK